MRKQSFDISLLRTTCPVLASSDSTNCFTCWRNTLHASLFSLGDMDPTPSLEELEETEETDVQTVMRWPWEKCDSGTLWWLMWKQNWEGECILGKWKGRQKKASWRRKSAGIYQLWKNRALEVSSFLWVGGSMVVSYWDGIWLERRQVL
jgi:hypothetical protein